MARTATKPAPKEIGESIEIEGLTIKEQSGGSAIHHMTRGLATEAGDGTFTVDQLDAHCQTWLDQGYKLFSVYPTYVKPEQGPGGTVVAQAQWHILYFFVRE